MTNQPFARKLEPIDSELYTQYRNCDRWAIIVGISRYQHSGWNLKYADRDADELYKLLLTSSGGNYKQENIHKLTNEQATTRNIRIELHDFLKQPAREDVVLLYFACHGSPDPDRPKNLYLLTHDTEPSRIAGTALPMREIELAIRETLLAEKVIVLADTCHSGAIGGGIGHRSASDDSAHMKRYLQELSKARAGTALLTSAETSQVARESDQWGGGHGVFTHYLLEGMRGAADEDNNGIVTIGELFEYVRDNVKRSTSNSQHPVIGSNFDRNMPIAIILDTISLRLSVTNQQDKLRPTLEGHPDLTSIIDNQLDLAHLAAINRHTTPDTDLQWVAQTNTEVWRQFITEHLYDTRRVTLEYFHLFEWFPIKPGQFHAPGAEEQRQYAYKFAEWHSGLAKLGYLPKGSSLDAGLYFNPHGKASMVRGGVGSVRLRPRSIHGIEYYFMTASSTGVCHEGFPVLIPRLLYGSLKRRILNEGAVPVTLSGEMRYIPDNILTFFGRHREIPLLYLHVDQVKELPQPRSEVTSYEVSAAISFVGNFEGREEKYITYANFAPESQASFQQACNWLEQFYVKKYAGTVITDFDEVIPRFPDAVFGLPDLMSGNLDRSRVQKFLQHQGLGEKTGDQFLAAYEELSTSGMLKA